MAQKRYDKGLKEIAILCGIEQRLTSYISCHIFVTTLTLTNCALIEPTSKMLGYKSLKTTQH